MKYVGENALKKWTSLVKSDIKKKLDKNQGTANSGKILGVDASGEVAPTDTEVATLVDVPNGIVKGNGSTLSVAVAGTDYMAPPTDGTTGQILKKTETGTEWADAPQTVTIPETTALLKGDGVGGVAAVTTDVTPTQGSTNPVQSGGVYSALNNKLDKTGDGSNVTAAFTAASTRANIATGEKLSVLFGKIAKWFADLGSLAFKSKVAKSDLASDVQTSLGKADSALQSVSKSDVGLGNVVNERQYSSANPPPYPVTSVNGKTGAVTVETSSGTTYNATLSSSGWTTSGSYKKQTVTVTGLKANYPVAPVVDAQLTGTDADGDTAVLTGFSAINLIQTATNQLIAYCIGDAPTVNIPLIINTWG